MKIFTCGSQVTILMVDISLCTSLNWCYIDQSQSTVTHLYKWLCLIKTVKHIKLN